MQAAMTALQMGSIPVPLASGQQQLNQNLASATATAMVPTQCFMLTNMFDPSAETGDNWDEDIKADVIDECRSHGGALHVYVDKGSAGNVYVKCPNIPAAQACVAALNNRWFSGMCRDI